MHNMKKYYTCFRLVVQGSLQYRTDFVLGWIISIFTLIAPIILWTAIFKENKEIYTYNFGTMLTYLIISNIFSKLLLSSEVKDTIAADIRDGRLSQFLFKPINYKLYMLVFSFGNRIFRFLLIFIPAVIAAGILSCFGKLSFNVSLGNIMLFIVSAVFAILLSYHIYYILGNIAFWMLECTALFITLDIIFFFLAGGLFPLDIFPKFKVVSSYLPFQYQLFFPVKICTGGLSPSEIFRGLFVQFVWIVIMMIISMWIWKKGMKKYSATGG